jgi:tetratricopeptide (TPR) repeat protein
MRSIFGAVLTCLLLTGCAGSEAPQAVSYPVPCTNPAESVPPATRIAACTQLLDSKTLSATEKSNALNDRGLAYLELGQEDRADADFDEAIRLYPKNAPAYLSRGNAYSEQGRHSRAIKNYDEAIRLDPEFALAYHDRGLTYQEMGDLKRALADFEKAGELDPDNASTANDIAWILATAPDPALRNGSEAVKWANRAVSLGSDSDYYDTLAAAFAETGRYSDARLQEEYAIQKLSPEDTSAKRDAYQERLQLYKQGKPYRS